MTVRRRTVFAIPLVMVACSHESPAPVVAPPSPPDAAADAPAAEPRPPIDALIVNPEVSAVKVQSPPVPRREEPRFQCPEHATCNPPRPSPPGAREPVVLRIVELIGERDGTIVVTDSPPIHGADYLGVLADLAARPLLGGTCALQWRDDHEACKIRAPLVEIRDLPLRLLVGARAVMPIGKPAVIPVLEAEQVHERTAVTFAIPNDMLVSFGQIGEVLIEGSTTSVATCTVIAIRGREGTCSTSIAPEAIRSLRFR